MRGIWSLAALGMVVLGAAGESGAQPVFVQQQRIDAPSGALAYGAAVAVDGATMAVSSAAESVNGVVNAGAVYIYVKSGNTWVLQQRLVAPLAMGGFGRAIDLSGDMIAVADHPNASTMRGTVRLYQRTGTSWAFHSLVQAEPAGVAGTFDDFGASVDLNGTRLIVGAPWFRSAGSTQSTGAAFVFDRTGTTWTGSRLPTGAQVRQGSRFGHAVDVEGDVACVGLPGGFGTSNSDHGGVAFYRRVSGVWTFQQGETGLAGNLLGSDCDVSGNLASVGRGEASGAGGARIYARAAGPTGDTWSVAADVTDDAGAAETVRQVGSTVFIGGERVTVWDRSSATAWTRRQTIVVHGRMHSDGETIVVGQPDGVWVYGLGSAPSGPPGAPTNVQASVSGSTLSVTWGAPTSGAAPTAYTLLARLAAGGPVVTEVPRGTATSFSTTAPNGTFVLSVRAANASGTGPESAGVTVTVPAAGAAPGAPSSLAATVSGSTVNFTWSAPSSGGAVGGYVLVAGVTPGFTSALATLPVGGSLGFAVPGVPAGTYYVRVVAENASGASAPSNEVAVTVAGAAPPGAPTLNTPTVSGSTVSLSWSAGSGSAPSSYTLVARMSPGGPPIATVPLGGTSQSFSNVPAGTYYLELTAANAAGTSPPSAQVTLVVP